MNSRSAIFLDRDGTIIVDQHYPRDPKKVELLPNAQEGMHLMSQKGYLLFVISNQSGVGRGIIQDHEFKAVHQRFIEVLQQAGIEIAEFAYCFHRPEDECGCRKPRRGLIPAKWAGETLDWKRSFTIGDRLSDVQLAESIGGQGFLVMTGKGKAAWDALSVAEREKYSVGQDLLDIATRIPMAKPA